MNTEWLYTPKLAKVKNLFRGNDEPSVYYWDKQSSVDSTIWNGTATKDSNVLLILIGCNPSLYPVMQCITDWNVVLILVGLSLYPVMQAVTSVNECEYYVCIYRNGTKGNSILYAKAKAF